jgi:hypothetical protein
MEASSPFHSGAKSSTHIENTELCDVNWIHDIGQSRINHLTEDRDYQKSQDADDINDFTRTPTLFSVDRDFSLRTLDCDIVQSQSLLFLSRSPIMSLSCKPRRGLLTYSIAKKALL